MKTSPGRPILRVAAIAGFAVLGLGACTSDPSPTRVADDLINTCFQDSNPCELSQTALAADPDVARECMLGKIDDVGKSELDKIGKDAASGDTATQAAAQAQLDALQVELESCLK